MKSIADVIFLIGLSQTKSIGISNSLLIEQLKTNHL
jgi:hypothetical protein